MSGNRLARRKMVERGAVALCVLALCVGLLPLAHILYTAVTIAAPKLHWTFLSQPAGGSPYIGTEGGVLNAIAGTVILLALGSLLAVPLGIVAGIYLAEFGAGRLGSLIRTLGDTLLGVPSVVWGLFGWLAFASPISAFGLHWHFSALSGGATLGLVMTPIIARVTELSLGDVPLTFREASLAVGATRWTTMRRIGLRVARPGIATGVLLALTNALGQTVALLFTNGYTTYLPHWPLWGRNNNVTDLGSAIYLYLSQPTQALQPPAEGAVIVLLGLVLALSLLSRALTLLGRRNYAR